MKKLLIYYNDLEVLFKNKETEGFAQYMIENCKRSKYGYNGEERPGFFYYTEVNDNFLKNLKEILFKTKIEGLNIQFIIELEKKLKKKEETTSTNVPEDFNLPY